MRRDHSDIETVNAALQQDRDRQEPAHYGWLVTAVLAAWFLVILTGSLVVRALEVARG